MRLILLVALLFACANAQSDQAANTKKTAETSKEERYGTQDNPLFIKIVSANKTPEDAKQEQIDREKKEAPEKRLGDLTQDLARSTNSLVWVGVIQLAVFLLQLIAFICQALYMRNALGLARDESVITNKPSIRIKHVFLMSDIWEGEKIEIELAIVNSGINSARITECNVVTLILPSERELPQIPPFSPMTIITPSYPFLPGGKTYILPNRWDRKKLTDEENAALRDRKSKLYCFGYVDYIDLTGMIIRKTAFCRELRLPKHPGSYKDVGRFVPLEEKNTDYEYAD